MRKYAVLLLRLTICCGVGSYVSGLLPSGTMLTTLNLSPAIVSVKYLSGSMVTVIVGLSFLSAFWHDDNARSKHIIDNNVFML
jgi:hypothetical protein